MIRRDQMEQSDSSSSSSPVRSGRPASSVGFAYQARLLERGSTHAGSLSRSGSVSTINSLTTGNSTSTPSIIPRRPTHRIGSSIDGVRGKWEERIRAEAEAVSDEKDLPSTPDESHAPDTRPSRTLSHRFPVSSSSETSPPLSRVRTSSDADVLYSPTYLKRHTIPAPIIASPLSPNATGVTVTNPDPPRTSVDTSPPADTAYRIRLPPSTPSRSISSVSGPLPAFEERRIDSQPAPTTARSRARTVDDVPSNAAGSSATAQQDELPSWSISPSRNNLPNPRRIRPTSVYEDLLTNAGHSDLGKSPSSPREPSTSRRRDLPLSGVGNLLPQVGAFQSSPAPSSAMHPPPYRSSYMSSKKASTYGKDLIVGQRLGHHLPRIASGDADDDWVADNDARIQREEEEARNERQKWREQRLERRAAIKHRGARETLTPITANPDDVAGIPGRLKLSRDIVPSTPTSSLPTTRLTRGLWADTQRHLIQAYEYLCHVGEAQQWIEGCLGEELGFGVVDMEESLRNGVVLAKLVKIFQGEAVVRRIYEAPKLDFRHSDNINYFFNFVRHVGLPEVGTTPLVLFQHLNPEQSFIFELTDLYEKKNLPKAIYCIHALRYTSVLASWVALTHRRLHTVTSSLVVV
jgi:Ras GTPase-activating-like protein IQGAP2/3